MKHASLPYFILSVILLQTPSLCQEMTVFLGLTGYTYYEDDRRLITGEVHSLLSENELAFTYWKRSRSSYTFAALSTAVALGTGIGIVARDENNNAPVGLYAASLGSSIIGIILSLSANNQKKKAVLTYNKGLENDISYKLVPIGSKDGFGIAIQF